MLPLLSKEEIARERKLVEGLGDGWANVARALHYIKSSGRRQTKGGKQPTARQSQQAASDLYQSILVLLDALMTPDGVMVPDILVSLGDALDDVTHGCNHPLLVAGELSKKLDGRNSRRTYKRLQADAAALVTFLRESGAEPSLASAAARVSRILKEAGYGRGAKVTPPSAEAVRRWPQQVKKSAPGLRRYELELTCLRSAEAEGGSPKPVIDTAIRALKRSVDHLVGASRIGDS